MGKGALIVAIGCGRLPGILEITTRHSFVVFGTMDGEVFSDLSAKISDSTTSSSPVNFYETG